MITLFRKCKLALFPDPLASCHAARPILNELAAELNAIATRINRGESNGIGEITRFFSVIAAVQDDRIVPKVIDELTQTKKHDLLVQRMTVLDAHLKNAGRHPYGMNRTVKKQIVTDVDVYLGNFDGWFTKTVAYTKAHRHETEFYAAMNRQAEQFMQSHIRHMIAIIREFDSEMSV